MVHGQLQRWADRDAASRFDRRYATGAVDFWAMKLSELATVKAGDRVFDVGCGTGGFAIGIARLTGAQVVGCDIAGRFIRFAESRESPVSWVVADAQELPFAPASADVVLMSLLLHRLPEPGVAVTEAARVLRPGGALLIKTIGPEDAAQSLPYRFFPTMARAQRRRMPRVEEILRWVRGADFASSSIERISRRQQIDLADLETSLVADRESRYPEMSIDELTTGLDALRGELARQPGQRFLERTTTVIKSIR